MVYVVSRYTKRTDPKQIGDLFRQIFLLLSPHRKHGYHEAIPSISAKSRTFAIIWKQSVRAATNKGSLSWIPYFAKKPIKLCQISDTLPIYSGIWVIQTRYRMRPLAISNVILQSSMQLYQSFYTENRKEISVSLAFVPTNIDVRVNLLPDRFLGLPIVSDI
jgi:hypothetical protein